MSTSKDMIPAETAIAAGPSRPPVRPLSTSAPEGMRADHRRHTLYLVAAVVVLVLALVLQVRGTEEVILPRLGIALPATCTLRTWTGINCPGCGLTRSFICLARGDLAGAWRFNPAGLLFFALVVVQVPYRSFQLWRLSRGRPAVEFPWLSTLIWIVLGAALVQWVWRWFAPWP